MGFDCTFDKVARAGNIVEFLNALGTELIYCRTHPDIEVISVPPGPLVDFLRVD